MREDIDARMSECRQDALSHRRPGHREVRVHRGDDHVELCERVVIEVEASIRQDVDLCTVQDGDRGEVLAHRFNGTALTSIPGATEPSGHAERLRVVGDRDVGVSARGACFDHFAQRVLSIGRVRVHVQIPTQIARLNEPRQFPFTSRGDLAAVLS